MPSLLGLEGACESLDSAVPGLVGLRGSKTRLSASSILCCVTSVSGVVLLGRLDSVENFLEGGPLEG